MVFSQQLNSHRIFKRLAKALIRLHIWAGWSEPFLVPHTTLLEISCRGSLFLIATLMSRDKRFKTMYYVQPAMAQISLHIGGCTDSSLHLSKCHIVRNHHKMLNCWISQIAAHYFEPVQENLVLIPDEHVNVQSLIACKYKQWM